MLSRNEPQGKRDAQAANLSPHEDDAGDSDKDEAAPGLQEEEDKPQEANPAGSGPEWVKDVLSEVALEL